MMNGRRVWVIWGSRGSGGCGCSWVLGQEGADPPTYMNFYNSVVQATLLFIAESKVMSTRIRKTLGGVHHRLASWLINMQLKMFMPDRWIYLPLDAEMKSVGMEEVATYVLHCHNTVDSYIATRMIMELCLEGLLWTGHRC